MQKNGRQGYVLLMDDDPGVRYMLGGMLRYLGYSVKTVTDGEKALQEYERALQAKRPYDIVILDVTVPEGMGGEQTIKKLREIDPNVVAVVSSGYSNDRVLAHYEQHGFSGVVVKPFRVEELGQVLVNALKSSD